jgi:hypothetical protein
MAQLPEQLKALISGARSASEVLSPRFSRAIAELSPRCKFSPNRTDVRT